MNDNEFKHDDNYTDPLSDQLAEDLVAYAMGVLPPAEQRALAAQIHASPHLQARLDALSATVDALAYSAPPVTPPPAAKARLLARIEAEPHAQAGAESQVPPAARSAPQRPPRAALRQPHQRAQRQPYGWFDWATGWKFATIAAASALLLFIAAVYSLQRELHQMNDELAAVQTELGSLRALNAELQQMNLTLQEQVQQQRTQLASLINVDQTVTLASNEAGTNASGTLFVGADSLTLLVHGLAPLPAAQTYELWLMPHDSNPIPSGLVTLTAAQGPYLITGLPRNAEEFAAVGLSIEPAGGSAQPTGPIVLLGTRTEPS